MQVQIHAQLTKGVEMLPLGGGLPLDVTLSGLVI